MYPWICGQMSPLGSFRHAEFIRTNRLKVTELYKSHVTKRA